MTDEQLLQQIAAGHEGSLEALIYRYHKPIYFYLQRMLGDTSLAEDLTQECFIRLCHAVKDERLPTVFRPWLYRIATNLCKDVWKSAAYRREALTTHDELSLHATPDTVTSILERQWEREAVIRALDQLEQEEKQIIILRFYQDLKIHEISDILQLPLSTTKSKLYTIYRKLAQLIIREEEKSHESRKKISIR